MWITLSIKHLTNKKYYLSLYNKTNKIMKTLIIKHNNTLRIAIVAIVAVACLVFAYHAYNYIAELTKAGRIDWSH
jgi:hypothetical protein